MEDDCWTTQGFLWRKDAPSTGREPRPPSSPPPAIATAAPLCYVVENIEDSIQPPSGEDEGAKRSKEENRDEEKGESSIQRRGGGRTITPTSSSPFSSSMTEEIDFSLVFERTEEDIKRLQDGLKRGGRRVKKKKKEGGGQEENNHRTIKVQQGHRRTGFLFLWPYLTTQPVFPSIADERDYGIFYEGGDGCLRDEGENEPMNVFLSSSASPAYASSSRSFWRTRVYPARKVPPFLPSSSGSPEEKEEEETPQEHDHEGKDIFPSFMKFSTFSSVRAAYAHPISTTLTTRSSVLRSSSMFLPPPPPWTFSSSSSSSSTPRPPPRRRRWIQRWMSQREAVEHWRYALLSRPFFFRGKGILPLRFLYLQSAMRFSELFAGIANTTFSLTLKDEKTSAVIFSRGTLLREDELVRHMRRGEREVHEQQASHVRRLVVANSLTRFLSTKGSLEALTLFPPIESVRWRRGDFYYHGPSQLLGRSIPRAMEEYLSLISQASAWGVPPPPRALHAVGWMHQLGITFGTGFSSRIMFALRYPEKKMEEVGWNRIEDAEKGETGGDDDGGVSGEHGGGGEALPHNFFPPHSHHYHHHRRSSSSHRRVGAAKWASEWLVEAEDHFAMWMRREESREGHPSGESVMTGEEEILDGGGRTRSTRGGWLVRPTPAATTTTNRQWGDEPSVFDLEEEEVVVKAPSPPHRCRGPASSMNATTTPLFSSSSSSSVWFVDAALLSSSVRRMWNALRSCAIELTSRLVGSLLHYFSVEEMVDPVAQQAFENLWYLLYKEYFAVVGDETAAAAVSGSRRSMFAHGDEEEEERAGGGGTRTTKMIATTTTTTAVKWMDVYDIVLAKEYYDDALQAARVRAKTFLPSTSATSLESFHQDMKIFRLLKKLISSLLSYCTSFFSFSSSSFSFSSSSVASSPGLLGLASGEIGGEASRLARATINFHWWYLHFSEKCSEWKRVGFGERLRESQSFLFPLPAVWPFTRNTKASSSLSFPSPPPPSPPCPLSPEEQEGEQPSSSPRGKEEEQGDHQNVFSSFPPPILHHPPDAQLHHCSLPHVGGEEDEEEEEEEEVSLTTRFFSFFPFMKSKDFCCAETERNAWLEKMEALRLEAQEEEEEIRRLWNEEKEEKAKGLRRRKEKEGAEAGDGGKGKDEKQEREVEEESAAMVVVKLEDRDEEASRREWGETTSQRRRRRKEKGKTVDHRYPGGGKHEGSVPVVVLQTMAQLAKEKERDRQRAKAEFWKLVERILLFSSILFIFIWNSVKFVLAMWWTWERRRRARGR